MDRRGSINTYQSLVSAFSELLTVAIHTILAERDVYPRTSFVKARKWGLAVFQSRHPGVIKWVEDAVESVEREILKGTVRQTSLVILSPAAVPLERYVFSTASFPALPASDALTPFAASTGNGELDPATADAAAVIATEDGLPEDAGEHRIPGVSVVDLAAQFRGLLSRVCSVGGRLAALPPDCSFTVAIELRDKPEGEPPIGWPQPFIPADPKSGVTAKPKSCRVTPVRNVDVGFFEMEAWIEETQDRIDMVALAAMEPAPVERSPSPEDDKISDPLLEAMEGKTFMS